MLLKLGKFNIIALALAANRQRSSMLLRFREIHLSSQDCRWCLCLGKGFLYCLHRLHCLLQVGGNGHVSGGEHIRPMENSAIFMMMHNNSTNIIRWRDIRVRTADGCYIIIAFPSVCTLNRRSSECSNIYNIAIESV